MDTNQLLDRIEAHPSEASTLIRKHGKEAGFSRAYCQRVIQHFGADTGKAIQLGSHWRTLLKRGDEPALAHRVRAIYERLKGRWQLSADAFIAAGDAANDSVEALAFKRGAIDSLARGGQIERAITLGQELAIGLEKLNQRGIAAQVKLNLANALSWQDRMAEARDYYRDAIPDLKRAGHDVDAVSARMGLSTSHLFGGSLREAAKEASIALSEATELDLTYLAALCEINLAHVELLSGRADAALDRLLRLKDQLQDAPVDHARTLEFLGDAYYRLNLWPEAIDAYQEVLGKKGLIALNRAHLHLGLGQALFAAGNTKESLTEIRTARKHYRRLGNRSWEAAALTAEARALADNRKQAVKVATQAVTLAERAGATFHQAEALMRLASLTGDQEVTRRAEKLITRQGYLGLVWRVHLAKARQAKGARKLHWYRQMFEAIQSGRMHVSSLAARASYLRDKSLAVQEYLELLLSRGNTEEAVRVIEQTRSVTLLDELLSAREATLSSDALERLRSLRDDLRELGTDDVEGGAARRSITVGMPMASLQRRWLDLTRSLRAEVASIVPQSRDGVIFATTADRFFALSRDAQTRLEISRTELERNLKWLQFELLAPMADREADAEDATEILTTLAERLIQPLENQDAICPDGILWRVPWSAAATLLGKSEIELRLHPSLGGHSQAKLKAHPNVALWSSNAPDLIHASTEAKQFLSIFPDAKIYTSGDQVRQMHGEYDLIHVIAHAKHRTSNPMFSAVSFHDGALFAAEIARLGIKADLVTLSACETGTMSVISRDEPDGLARAFLARGARNVIASQWPLDDEAAARMFGTFMASLTGGGSVAESLSRARQDARAWRPHPYFWGSLSLYGGYANR